MEDGLWDCQVCTFRNQGSHVLCSMCARLRPGIQRISNRYRPSPPDSLELYTADTNEGSTDIVESRRGSREQSPLCSLPRLLGSAVSGAVTGIFAIVGAITGAVTGALAGRATEGGLLRGAGLGAVAGAVLSVEFLEASRTFWFTERPPSRSSSSMGEFLDEILSGRFVQDQVGPSTPPHRQVNIDDMTYEELYEMFGPGDVGIKGASEASLQALPWHIIIENGQDIAGERSCCTICLQELLHGEAARSLPRCNHTFHKACVDEWLIQQGSCPVCRHAI
ncbi:hypothetical protein O6H91_19G045900 [Diphasiastrum complanatum]|uniref:Uncharacterized protein n=1 Tax=Diphasiastrum complanatum TaxID=34168 RepID=A0ACC2AW89_DIPCM|nr:hypothetical protein O6H91_19G045900 [Diphasiastrum complanatum]